MRRNDLPNLITLLRILLIFPMAGALLSGRYPVALLLFLLAGASDGLDGFLARRYGWTSNLGAVLDPLADKLMLVTVYLLLGYIGFVPLWIVVTVLVRDIVILAGAALYFLLFGRFAMAPLLLSKVNTFLQIALVAVALLSYGVALLPVHVVEPLTYVVFASTLSSGLAYVTIWGRRAWRNRK